MQTAVFAMQIPPGYKYEPIDTRGGLAGRWVRRTGKGQSSIGFFLGVRFKAQSEGVASSCHETIHGQQTRIETGIGPAGRYFVRAEWLRPQGSHENWYLVVSADAVDPGEQLESLSAIRTIEVKGGNAR